MCCFDDIPPAVCKQALQYGLVTSEGLCLLLGIWTWVGWGGHRPGQCKGNVAGPQLQANASSAKVPIRLAFAKQIEFKLIVALQNSMGDK